MSEIMDTLLAIRDDIGGLKAMVGNHNAQVKDLDTAVRNLQLAAARQKGAARVWGLVGGAASGLVGAIAEAVVHGRHS